MEDGRRRNAGDGGAAAARTLTKICMPGLMQGGCALRRPPCTSGVLLGTKNLTMQAQVVLLELPSTIIGARSRSIFAVSRCLSSSLEHKESRYVRHNSSPDPPRPCYTPPSPAPSHPRAVFPSRIPTLLRSFFCSRADPTRRGLSPQQRRTRRDLVSGSTAPVMPNLIFTHNTKSAKGGRQWCARQPPAHPPAPTLCAYLTRLRFVAPAACAPARPASSGSTTS
eukprot:COSAG04_NODE_4296_length_2177_cov_2.509143_3_plen_223_part_01